MSLTDIAANVERAVESAIAQATAAPEMPAGRAALIQWEQRRARLRESIFAALVARVGLVDDDGPRSDYQWQCDAEEADRLAYLASACWSVRDATVAAAIAPPDTPDTRPETCHDIPGESCALHPNGDEARIPEGSFTDPIAWRCRSCRLSGSGHRLKT